MILKRREEVNRKNFATLLTENVSELCKVYDGSGYTFVKLNLSNKGLMGINEAIWKYPHLREIELNNNFISSFQALAKLQK